jgi:hypothetical protein
VFGFTRNYEFANVSSILSRQVTLAYRGGSEDSRYLRKISLYEDAPKTRA